MQETFGYSDRIESRIDANDGNMNCYMIAYRNSTVSRKM